MFVLNWEPPPLELIDSEKRSSRGEMVLKSLPMCISNQHNGPQKWLTTTTQHDTCVNRSPWTPSSKRQAALGGQTLRFGLPVPPQFMADIRLEYMEFMEFS